MLVVGKQCVSIILLKSFWKRFCAPKYPDIAEAAVAGDGSSSHSANSCCSSHSSGRVVEL